MSCMLTESDQPVRPGIPPPMPGQRPLPDSDPLQQWRLRRRMEQAQQSAPQNMQNFNFLSKSDHEVGKHLRPTPLL